MWLKEVVLAPKSITDLGKWQEGGRVPRTAFYLSKPKNRSYRLGSYRWRVVQFTALGSAFRLLVAYHAGKEQFRAVLAVEHERDMSVLAQYEFHGTHPGWHVLATCDEEIEGVPRGIMRGPWQQRLPTARGYHRLQKFTAVDDDHALEIAAKKFRLWKREWQLL